MLRGGIRGRMASPGWGRIETRRHGGGRGEGRNEGIGERVLGEERGGVEGSRSVACATRAVSGEGLQKSPWSEQGERRGSEGTERRGQLTFVRGTESEKLVSEVSTRLLCALVHQLQCCPNVPSERAREASPFPTRWIPLPLIPPTSAARVQWSKSVRVPRIPSQCSLPVLSLCPS